MRASKQATMSSRRQGAAGSKGMTRNPAGRAGAGSAVQSRARTIAAEAPPSARALEFQDAGGSPPLTGRVSMIEGRSAVRWVRELSNGHRSTAFVETYHDVQACCYTDGIRGRTCRRCDPSKRSARRRWPRGRWSHGGPPLEWRSPGFWSHGQRSQAGTWSGTRARA